MAPSIHVFVQVALLFCMVTTTMGGITDFEKKISRLENKVKDSQKEMKSLQQIIQQLEERLEILEENGEFDEIQIQPAVLLFMPVSQDYPSADYKVHEFNSLHDVTLHW